MLVIVGIECTLLGLTFMFVGFAIQRRLQQYFNEFYLENRKILLFATFGLSLPILFRGLVDLLRAYVASVENFANTHDIIFNVIMYFFSDVIPNMLQLSTLIFGYIRRRNEKKYRLEIG